jgi:hypothetical protein
LLQSHQQGLVFLRFTDGDFLPYDAPGFCSVVLASDDDAEPLNCLSEGLDGQLTSHLVGCYRILKCRGLGLDASRPDVEPFGKMLGELMELRISLECGFEAVEYPSRGVREDKRIGWGFNLLNYQLWQSLKHHRSSKPPLKIFR